MADEMTRRTFLGTTAPIAAGAMGATLPASSGGAAIEGANETLGIGLIGCGGRGRHVLTHFKRQPDVRIVGVCDVHKKRLAEGMTIAEGRARAYDDYRDLLANKDIDAVLVATNGHWHVLPAIDACAAGKDVYLEKPVGTSIGEGRAAINASKKYNRIIHMGTQQRSWDHYHEAVEIIRSGKLGDISSVEVFDLENFWPGFGSPPDSAPPSGFNWEFYLGPSPKVPYNPNRFIRHYWFFDYGGGWQLDWAVHHYDIVNWAMGVESPIAATGAGGKYAYPDDNTQWPDTFNGACEYGPGPVAKRGFLLNYRFRGGCNRPTEGRGHGKVFYGSDAALALDRTGFEIFSQYRDGKKVVEERRVPSHAEHDATGRHVRRFLDCVKSREPSPADIEKGHFASNPGHLMNIAWRVGRRIAWDAERERVVNDPEADLWVTKRYRDPWVLPS